MHFTQTIMLGFSVLFLASTLGAACVYCFFKPISEKLHLHFWAFAAGVMLAASVWSLLLPALSNAENGWGRYAFIPVALGFLMGAAALELLEKVKPERLEKGGLPPTERRLFLAVTLHNIPEGIAVGVAFGAARALGVWSAYAVALGLAIGIAIQNIPESAALSLALQKKLNSKNQAFFWGVLSGAVEPVFALLSYFLVAWLIPLQPWLSAAAAGTMFFVVIQDIFPEIGKDGQGRYVWSALFGFVFMMILDVFLGG